MCKTPPKGETVQVESGKPVSMRDTLRAAREAPGKRKLPPEPGRIPEMLSPTKADRNSKK